MPVPVRAVPSTGAVPQHVAIIMDGNRRWAEREGLPKLEGHRRGVVAVRAAVRAASAHGVRYLTLYSFSTENWQRPPEEVDGLLGLLRYFIRHDLKGLHAQNVRVRVIGGRDDLTPDIRALLEEAESFTHTNTGLTLVVAFNYGARQEIARAVQALLQQMQAGALEAAQITPETIAQHLDTHAMPDPDLVIRTSGEQRLSNFLLWQSAYAEFVFLQDLWPDFNEQTFAAALAQYQERERRFGGRLDEPQQTGTLG
jgi:undecaprenyl diphosphate synthase